MREKERWLQKECGKKGGYCRDRLRGQHCRGTEGEGGWASHACWLVNRGAEEWFREKGGVFLRKMGEKVMSFSEGFEEKSMGWTGGGS